MPELFYATLWPRRSRGFTASSVPRREGGKIPMFCQGFPHVFISI